MYDPIYDLYEDGYGCSEALAILQECGVNITLERVAAVYDKYNHMDTQPATAYEMSFRVTDELVLA